MIFEDVSATRPPQPHSGSMLCMPRTTHTETAMDRKTAYIILNMLPGIGPVRVSRLLRHFVTPEAIFTAPEKEILQETGLSGKTVDTLLRWREFCNPEAEWQLAQAAGVHLLTREDNAYPPLLQRIPDPPICLYWRGDLRILQESQGSIAIVGSRHTTAYGLKMAEQFAAAAAMAGWPVVSGLARGIDTAAHRATLQNGGRTIAVLGSGFCHLYPRENLPLAREICESGGAVLSEFPMAFQADRRSFPMRNRIISGISCGTVVVEAGLQSGSLITAAAAVEQNRTVFAVPGRADSPFSRGCHALLRDGARLAESFSDVIDEFTLLPDLEQKQLRRTREPPAVEAPVFVSAGEWTLWDALSDEETDLDDLVTRLDLPASVVLGHLLMLELKSLVQQLPGKKVRRLPGKTAKKRE